MATWPAPGLHGVAHTQPGPGPETSRPHLVPGGGNCSHPCFPGKATEAHTSGVNGPCPTALQDTHPAHTCLRTVSWICSNSQRVSASAPLSQASACSASASLPLESRKRGELGIQLSSRTMMSTGPSPATASQRQGSSRPVDRSCEGLGRGRTQPLPPGASEQPHSPSRVSPRAASYRKPTLVSPSWAAL